MSESGKVNTGTVDGKRKDADKARELVERDTPDEAAKREAEKPGDDRDKVYRPEENVDNQKSSAGRAEPAHQKFIDRESVSGGQAREKKSQKDNINDKAEDADSPRRNG